MKIALVYDRINKWGGAERVLLALHKLFPNAPLFTSVYEPKKAGWASVFDVKTSFLQKIPYASSSHEYLPIFMPLAFESFSFDEFDVVISITSEAAKGIITKPKTLHICYCLTPTRYLWSGYEDYFKNLVLKTLASPFISYLRSWDRVAAQRPDYYIAISKEVQGRIKKYYGRESEVVYPPVTLASSSRASSVQLQKKELNANKLDAKRYFLVVSRLVPYKRVDIAIEACNRLRLPLRIVGVGSQEQELKQMAGPTVEFLGNLTDKELIEYYKNCRALVFAGVEDLGLTILEAQSFGKPIVAYKGGGALETIIDGKTGEFFGEQTTESLINVLKQFDERKYKSLDCIKNAERFSVERFEREFVKLVEEKMREYFSS